MPYYETTIGEYVYYEDHGPTDDAALVLLCPDPFGSVVWSRNIPALSSRYRTVAIDMRGRGRSSKTSNRPQLSDYAEDVHDIVQHLGVSAIVAVGWSIGAGIWLQYIKQFGSEGIRAYANLEQHPRKYDNDEATRERIIARIHRDRIGLQRDRVLDYVGRDGELEESELVRLFAEAHQIPTDIMISTLSQIISKDYRDVWAQLDVPIQIHWSEFGTLTPGEVDELLGLSKDGSSFFYPGMGHFFPMTCSEQVNGHLISLAERVL